MLSDAPAPLKAAASLVVVEALILALFGVAEVANVTQERAVMGATTAVFFVVYAAGLVLCAWAIAHLHSWARSPLVLAQLIQLGVAWSFRGGGTWLVSLVLALVAAVTLVGLLHPDSIKALSQGD